MPLQIRKMHNERLLTIYGKGIEEFLRMTLMLMPFHIVDKEHFAKHLVLFMTF